MSKATKQGARDRALILAIETLALYADPKSYFAIVVVADRPAGWFADDLSRSRLAQFNRRMHGEAARKALAKIERMLK